MAVFEITFKVEGAWMFPVDMLRYDECHPATESDSVKIQRSHDTENEMLSRVIITLKRWSNRRNWRPTDDRWKSLLWSVVPGSITSELKAGI